MATLEELLKKTLGDDSEALSDILEQASKEATAVAAKEAAGLKKKRDELLKANTKLKENQIPDNFDMEEYNSLVAKKAEMEAAQQAAEEAKLVGSENWDTLKKQLNMAHAEELTTVQTTAAQEYQEIRDSYFGELKTNALMSEIQNEKGNSFFLLPHALKNVDIRKNEDTGAYTPVIIDAKGDPRLDDTTGEPLTVKNLILEMKADDRFAPAFPEQNLGTGQGVNAPRGTKGVKNPWKRDTPDYNMTTQAQMIREKPELARALMKAAGVDASKL